MEQLRAVEKTLFVSASSPVGKLGSAIAHSVYEGTRVELRAIGAGAISQAMKAVAVARGYVAPRGYDLAVVPGFAEVQMPDRLVTAMTFTVLVS